MEHDWYQQHLTPPQVVQVNARLGVVPGEDHGQWFVELVDPTNNVQMGAWSCPHFPLAHLARQLEHMVQRMDRAVIDSIEPF